MECGQSYNERHRFCALPHPKVVKDNRPPGRHGAITEATLTASLCKRAENFRHTPALFSQ